MKLPFTLKQLRILKAIASKKNFTKAAKMLFISQPTLSKQLQMLEDQLGVCLINRRTTPITLTDAGKAFLLYSERILSLCEESCRILNDLKHGYTGNLIVGTNKTISDYIIPRIITLFIKIYPQFNIKLYIHSTKKIINHLTDKNIDIAIINNYILVESNPYFFAKNMIEDEIVLIISKKTKKRITVKQLYEKNFILFKSNAIFYKFLQKKIARKTTKQFKFIMKLKTTEGNKRAINLGLGFNFISKRNIKNSLIIKIKNIKMLRKLNVIQNKLSNKSNILKLFEKEVRILQNLKN